MHQESDGALHRPDPALVTTIDVDMRRRVVAVVDPLMRGVASKAKGFVPGNTYGVATVGGATADEFNSSILYNCPSPSSYGTQTYDCDSFSNCY